MELFVKSQNVELARVLRNLPVTVRVRVDIDVMERALENDFVEISADGGLLWIAGSKTLLTYFCGRMFCGDTSRYSRRKGAMLWHKGRGRMPESVLGRLFGVTCLKRIRNRRANKRLPEGFELVERLFDV